MSPKNEKILNDALLLPPIERAELIERLLSSFQFSNRKEIDLLWSRESEDRIDAFERGEIGSVSAREVFQKIDRN